MKELPVLLLTGYLGSGKTTLLNRILTNKKGIRFAVIVNDIGEVNIDASLIEQGGVVGKKDESLVALQNGCICCTLKMDLIEQIREITAMKRFDYIVIEASGICEPEPIAQTICSIPQMGPEFIKDGYARLDCIVTIVDALRMRDEFNSGSDLTKAGIGEEDIESLVIQQIEFCNIVLLNKASEITPEELEKVRRIVRELQPKAEIIDCDYGDVPFEKILHTNLFNFDKVATSATWISKVEGAYEEEEMPDQVGHDHDHDHDHDNDDHDLDDDDQDDVIAGSDRQSSHHDHDHHHHHHHHEHEGGEVEEYGIGTYVYYRRQPLDINKFDNFIARRWPKDVIRAKGLCYFTQNPDICYLFEQAGKQIGLKNVGQWFATMPADQLEIMMMRDPVLQRDWDDNYGDRMQKIVFIGQHLNKKEIADALDACLVDEVIIQ
ncbi:MAG: GTP-binding protein [Bacteroidales bacterium]|nr:GTP-binding protein [Bacteroidales bacterium]